MMKKIVQIFIGCCFWLCLVPSFIYILNHYNIWSPQGIMGHIVHYIILFLVLIIVYYIIHNIFETCYMKHQLRKRIRKITIKRQLERLERGEISLNEAQNMKTFTRPKSPKAKKKAIAQSPSKASTLKKSASTNSKGSHKSTKSSAPSTPIAAVRSPKKHREHREHGSPLPPPPYTEIIRTDADTAIKLDED